MGGVGKRIWAWFKEAGNLISVFFLVFVLGFLSQFAIEGTLFGGSIDSARYLLSALAQTQGAIIAIVISLTIVAVQVSSQAYSLRITDILLRYQFFWFMLFLYGLSIIYDVTLLNRINQSNIGSLGTEVNVTVFIAAIALWALFPYSKKTIERLRPQTIMRTLGKHILFDCRGTFDTNRIEAIFPLFDATKKAIRGDDIATARDGMREIERVCCEILAEGLNEQDEKSAMDYFCQQYQRTAKIAFAQDDTDSVLEVSRSLELIADNILQKELSRERADIVVFISSTLSNIGRSAIDRSSEDVLSFVANSLGNLTVKCEGERSPDIHIFDDHGTEVIASGSRYTANVVLRLLLDLNISAATTTKDVFLAARNTKEPLINASVRLIEKDLDFDFYKEMMIHNFMPFSLAARSGSDWIPDFTDVFTAIGIKCAEHLGKGTLERYFRDGLVFVVSREPTEEPISSKLINSAMVRMYDFLKGVKGDAGAIWLIEAFEGIGIEYGRAGYNDFVRSAIIHLGRVGSSLNLESKLFTVELACKALDSIASVLKASCDKGQLMEQAFKAVFKIMAETDDKKAKGKALAIYKESSRSIEESAFKQTVEKCINEFRTENKADLETSAKRKARLDHFIGDLQT